MEKRLIAFLVLSTVLIFAWMQLATWLAPPRPVPDSPTTAQTEGNQKTPPKKPATTKDGAQGDVKTPSASQESTPKSESSEEQAKPTTEAPQQWITLGSMDPKGSYRLLVTLTNRGAAVERIELNDPAYPELEQTVGYLGHLAFRNAKGGGCTINAVGHGTPASLAQPKSAGAGVGLKPGDVIIAADGTPIADVTELADFLGEAPPGKEYRITDGKKPGTKVTVTVRRQTNGQPQELQYVVTLGKRPLQIMQPEWNDPTDPETRHPASFLLTLESIGKSSISSKAEEIAGLPSLYDKTWEMRPIKDGVEFAFRLTDEQLDEIGQTGSLEIVKRYRLTPPAADGGKSAQYHLDFDIELRNLGDQPQEVAYRLNGPNGLPLEGWWYITRIHPKMFQSAGARDVIWTDAEGRFRMFGGPNIVKQHEKETRPELFTPVAQAGRNDQARMANAGVDTQYFAAALIPAPAENAEDAAQFAYQRGWAFVVGEVDRENAARRKTSNVSYRLASVPHKLPPGGTYRESFKLFAGPKHPEVMEAYGLDAYIYYGWFGWVSRPMVGLLHFFESFLFNYGLAIILLTILVRGAMFPLGRKAAMNAKKMQELAPEMKAIAEKYKDDMQKRAEAQQALFRKHNYNPFGGCFLLFLQLPVFLGLYRGLATDIELRGAPLIPGLSWCSNLAGPDMLWFWEPFLPGFLADPGSGWLGPFFNVLPMVTIGLFLVHQKLFMPPATDEQTRLQQQVMTFMMVFMGVMFFRVPAGLCVYFIVSSLWGIFERTVLLPKSPPPGSPPEVTPAGKKSPEETKKSLFSLSGNGTTKLTPQERRKQRQKRK